MQNRGRPRAFARSFAFTAAFSLVLAVGGCQDQIEDDSSAAQSLAEQARIVSQVDISPSHIRFRAGAEDIEIALVPNTQLLAPDAVIMRDGVALTPEEAGIELPYRGHVVGDPDSWVRVRVEGDRFEGLIFTEESLWEVREVDAGEAWMLHSNIGDYLDTPTHANHHCATSEAEAAHATYAAYDGAARAQSCTQVSIALVADYTHVAALGGAKASEAEMLARINEADGIFRSDLDYGFSVGEIRTFAKAGGPAFNQAESGDTPLETFADYKQSKLPELGLAHLFVARTKYGAVGLAYVGSTCSSRYGSGVSNYLGKGKASTIVVTHEIGHNFGSPHDPASSDDVMAPSVNVAATEFSNASEDKINAHVASVSCFEPCAADPSNSDD